MKFRGIVELHFLGLFGPTMVELCDVGVTVLFREKTCFVRVEGMRGVLWGGERDGGERNTGVTLGTKWPTGEGVEKTCSMATVSCSSR